MTTTEPRSAEDLREQVAVLLAGTRTALESDERAFALVEDFPDWDDDAPLRIAIAGPHNAGKSMLIAALLGLPQDQVEAITGAVPLTDEITPYEWSGYTLLDLPGTLSGLDAHDTVAAVGVRRADLLLLVTSVELPGESETEQIRHLLAGEGFARRVLVVLNKCNSEDSDLDVVRAEMLDRLSPFPWIEPLFADAKEYVDARNADGLTEQDRDAFREGSGLDALVSALTTLAVKHGPTARLQAVCHEVRRISIEASEQWAPDPEEETQQIVADRIRSAFADVRRELTEASEIALETLAERIAAVGNRLAGAVSEEDASVDERNASVADQDEATAQAQYEAEVNRAVDDALVRLDAQLDTTLDDWGRYSAGLKAIAPEIERGHSRKKPRLFVDRTAEKVWDAGVGKAQEKLKAFVEGGVREGSQAHHVAKRLRVAKGGAPAKAYEHIHRAEKLTKAGRRFSAAAEFLSPLVDAKGMIDGIRRAEAVKKRQADIRSRYAGQAADAMAQERAGVEAYIDERLSRRHAAVAAMLDRVEESTRARTEAQSRWQEHAERASALAALLDEELARQQPAPEGRDSAVESGASIGPSDIRGE